MAFAYMLELLAISVLLADPIVASASGFRNASTCTCGFYERSTGNIFTEALIVYLNETSIFPSQLLLKQSYVNTHEKGWNTLYRQGMDPSNVLLSKGNTSDASVELFIDPAQPNHVVEGGSMRTTRQDLLYGSFRMYLKPAPALGTALSAEIVWNETQQITMNAQTTDEWSTAWVSMLTSDEFPDRKLGVNYTVLANSTNHISPMEYNEYRIDWTATELNYSIAHKVFRRLEKHGGDANFPQTPAPLTMKHWSVGNYYSMQGPPASRTVGNVGWIRFFFNSSLADDATRKDFAARCKMTDACDMDDVGLRGFSPFNETATLVWEQLQQPRSQKAAPIAIMAVMGTLSLTLIINSLYKRTKAYINDVRTRARARSSREDSADAHDPPSTDLPKAGGPSSEGSLNQGSRDINFDTPSPRSRRSSEVGHLGESSIHWSPSSSDRNSGRKSWRVYSHESADQNDKDHTATYLSALNSRAASAEKLAGQGEPLRGLGKVVVTEILVPPTPTQSMGELIEPALRGVDPARDGPAPVPDREARAPSAGLPSAKKRVDYLAGLLALSSLLVTAIHFCLTFANSAINPGAFVHYQSETWARKTVSSYFLNLIWIGPFLMTSTRFLVSRYLKSQDLGDVAEKTVGRPFRLLIPVTAIAMLEYFLMDSGATDSLQSLPSVTWSTWPFATVPKNFGYFVSEIVELAYLIPNAAPQITFNYCTGVLWTIPVQLQGTWVTLLAVIMICEIRKPWKRFGFYTLCIVISWYALSWGTYFWLGILFTDLDLTFKYRKWLHARPRIYELMLFLFAAAALGGLTLDCMTQWTGVNYATYEYGVHPDLATGLPIRQTGANGYPQYYVPKLHGVVFSVGVQGVLELSPAVQKLFSFRVFMWIFPHIFTIYLVHGFIFWSIGALLCLKMAAHSFPYWLNLVVVAVVCYAVLFASLNLLTPVVETLGKHVTSNIWVYAHDQRAPRRHTLYPWPRDFLSMRGSLADSGAAGDEEKRNAPWSNGNGRRGASLRSFLSKVARPRVKDVPHGPSHRVHCCCCQCDGIASTGAHPVDESVPQGSSPVGA